MSIETGNPFDGNPYEFAAVVDWRRKFESAHKELEQVRKICDNLQIQVTKNTQGTEVTRNLEARISELKKHVKAQDRSISERDATISRMRDLASKDCTNALRQVNKEQAEKIERLEQCLKQAADIQDWIRKNHYSVKEIEGLKADKYYMASRIKAAIRFLNEALSARGLNAESSFPKVAGEKTGEFNGR